jgi:hypothetical protein
LKNISTLVCFLLFLNACSSTIEEQSVETVASTVSSQTTTSVTTSTTTTMIDTTTSTIIEGIRRRGIIKNNPFDDIPREINSGHKRGATKYFEEVTYEVESDAVAYNLKYFKLNESEILCAEKINSDIVSRIEEAVAVEEDLATYYTKEDAEADGLMYINYLELSYNLVELGDVYSIIYFWHSYSTGAAHPITNPMALSYSLNNCELINIRDIFDTSSDEYLKVLDQEIINQLCAPLSVEDEKCRYDDDYATHKNFVDGKGADILNTGSTQFAVGIYGLFIQFWEYDFYYASGSELILLPWKYLEDVLDKDGVYVDDFMRAYCVFDTYNFTDYEPMWTWICED